MKVNPWVQTGAIAVMAITVGLAPVIFPDHPPSDYAVRITGEFLLDLGVSGEIACLAWFAIRRNELAFVFLPAFLLPGAVANFLLGSPVVGTVFFLLACVAAPIMFRRWVRQDLYKRLLAKARPEDSDEIR